MIDASDALPISYESCTCGLWPGLEVIRPPYAEVRWKLWPVRYTHMCVVCIHIQARGIRVQGFIKLDLIFLNMMFSFWVSGHYSFRGVGV